MLLDCDGDNDLRESVYNFRNYFSLINVIKVRYINKYARFINVY